MNHELGDDYDEYIEYLIDRERERELERMAYEPPKSVNYDRREYVFMGIAFSVLLLIWFRALLAVGG